MSSPSKVSKRLSTTSRGRVSAGDDVAAKRVCHLKPLHSDGQTAVQLIAGKNIVGRSKETGIRDTVCSKEQLELRVDLQAARIKLKVLGVNPSSVNGLKTAPSAECELEHGDIVEIVYGRHPFEVHFKPPPPPTTPAAAPHQGANGNGIHGGVDDAAGTAELEKWDAILDGKVVIYNSAGVRASEKVASYDIDGTIIKTKSGNVFPKHVDDWQLNYPDHIPQKLKSLHDSGYKICFFTNQAGIAKGKVLLSDFKRKIKEIVRKLQVPVQVYIAVDDGYYRKPRPGMWEHMQETNNEGIPLRLDKCFFVGDAAGRPELGTGPTKRRKDHSLADRLFATNVGIAFYTPEEHFLSNRLEEWVRPDFNPSVCLPADDCKALLDPPSTKLPALDTELIIMVGLPGSGKSHFTQHHLSPLGYVIANADTMGSVKACLGACERALAARKSCVVDNTNVDVESRKKFIELGRKLKVPCRAFEIIVPLGQVKHNLVFRGLTDNRHSKINDMVFNGMKKKYKSPTLAEGFVEVVKVNFNPNFTTKENERLYKLHLSEK